MSTTAPLPGVGPAVPADALADPAQLDRLAWLAQYRDLHQAAALGERLLLGGHSAEQRAAGACHRAFALIRLGRRDEGEAMLALARQALDSAATPPHSPDHAAAQAACRHVQALLWRRDKAPERALALLAETLALPDAVLAGLPAHLRCVCHNLSALSASELGRLDDALRHYLLARHEAHLSQDDALLANASANLSGVQADLLNLDDAAALADEAMAAADAAGLRGEFVWLTAHYNRCYTALAAGQGDLALAVASTMRRYSARVSPAKHARYELLWATAAVATGRLTSAARLLARSRRRWTDSDDLLLEWSVVRAALDNRAGRFAQARRVCDAARGLTTSGGEEALPQDRMRLFEQGSRACEALGDAAGALAYARLAFAQYELIAGRSARARRITTEAQVALALERRARDEALRSRRAAEAEQQRLAVLNTALHEANLAKTRFLAAASHDLRQPLHALALESANLRHALAGVPGSPGGQAAGAAAQRMERSVLALSAMFDALLDITQIESGGLTPRRAAVPIKPLLLRLAEELQPLAEARGLRLALRLPRGTSALRLDTDPALLETMLRNLLSNALKYTRQGGVLLALRRCQAQAGQWRLQVIDTGVGIAPDWQQRVFDDFVQIGNDQRQRSQGLGLGLAIVRRLAALLAHPLALRSTPGRGTGLSLQLGEAAAGAARAACAAEPGVWQPLRDLSGRWVAVVEDQPDALRALVELLHSWQIRTVAADSGQKLLEHLHQHPGSPGQPPRPQALVTDLRLPGGLDGLALAARLRAQPHHAALPVLVVSADPAPPGASGVDWLAKPVQALDLRAWLEKHLP